jgi:hypothetical protein
MFRIGTSIPSNDESQRWLLLRREIGKNADMVLLGGLIEPQ